MEPLRASGRVTLKADVIDESSRSVTNHTGCWNRSQREKHRQKQQLRRR